MAGTGLLPLAEREKLQPGRSAMIRDSLAAQGDDGRASRLVTHYLYPDPGATRPAGDRAMRAAMEAEGFAVRQTAGGDGLILERTDSVAAGPFDALIASLAKEVAAMGWYYDGWESPVYKR